MTAAEYDAYIQRLVDRAPPPTAALQSRLRILLTPSVEQLRRAHHGSRVAA